VPTSLSTANHADRYLEEEKKAKAFALSILLGAVDPDTGWRKLPACRGDDGEAHCDNLIHDVNSGDNPDRALASALCDGNPDCMVNRGTNPVDVGQSPAPVDKPKLGGVLSVCAQGAVQLVAIAGSVSACVSFDKRGGGGMVQTRPAIGPGLGAQGTVAVNVSNANDLEGMSATPCTPSLAGEFGEGLVGGGEVDLGGGLQGFGAVGGIGGNVEGGSVSVGASCTATSRWWHW
jgi:hypothetical protein